MGVEIEKKVADEKYSGYAKANIEGALPADTSLSPLEEIEAAAKLTAERLDFESRIKSLGKIFGDIGIADAIRETLLEFIKENPSLYYSNHDRVQKAYEFLYVLSEFSRVPYVNDERGILSYDSKEKILSFEESNGKIMTISLDELSYFPSKSSPHFSNNSIKEPDLVMQAIDKRFPELK